MAWAYMAASGTGLLIFIDIATHDGSASLQKYSGCQFTEKCIQSNFIVLQDNDPKHNTTKKEQKKWEVLDWKKIRFQSLSLHLHSLAQAAAYPGNVFTHSIYLLKNNNKASRCILYSVFFFREREY